MAKKYNLEGLYKEHKEEGFTITLSLYKLVIRLFWKKVSKEIINGFTLETLLGKFLVATIKRRIKLSKEGNIINNINWGASNKRKKELIESGKVPFEAYRNEEGIVIGDNGGEEWLVYFVDNHYFTWVWQKNPYITNSSKYQFTICKANRLGLSASINEDSILLYQYRDGNYKKNIEPTRHRKNEEVQNTELQLEI